MAGDWIKMRASLLTDPKVHAIAQRLASNPEVCIAVTGARCALRDASRDVTRDVTACNAVTSRVARSLAIVGLISVWTAANEHSEDGRLRNANFATLDAIADIDGFGAAMAAVGWAVYDEQENAVTLPNFSEYNRCAKARSTSSAAERQRRYRERKKAEREAPRTEATGDMRDVTRDVTVTQRREDNNTRNIHTGALPALPGSLEPTTPRDETPASRVTPPGILVHPVEVAAIDEPDTNDPVEYLAKHSVFGQPRFVPDPHRLVVQLRNSYPNIDLLRTFRNASRWVQAGNLPQRGYEHMLRTFAGNASRDAVKRQPSIRAGDRDRRTDHFSEADFAADLAEQDKRRAAQHV